MSKRLVTAVCLVWGAALAANCGGDSEGGTANPGGGSGGDAGEAPSAGKTSKAGDSATGGTSAAGTTSGGSANGGVPAEAGQSAGGEATLGGAAGAAGMSVGGEIGMGGGDSVAGAGGADGTPVSVCPATIDKYPEVFAKAVCEKRVDCCTSDLDACMKEESDALAALLPELLKSKQDGIVAANCAALDKCVAAIAASKCEDWPAETGTAYGIPVNEPACRQWIEPKLLPLDTCTANYQCVDGYCAGNNPKKCTAFAADGASCAAQVCNLTTSYCDANKKCAPRLANGNDCKANGECASRICDTGGTNKCIAPGAAQCEYVPASCAFVGMPRDGVGWSLVVGAFALGTAMRRRRARPAKKSS